MRLTDNQGGRHSVGLLVLICAERRLWETPISVLECAESPAESSMLTNDPVAGTV